jgi:hypothetical protein
MDLILYIRIMWRVLGLRRVGLKFVPGLEVEFCDRVRGIKQVYEFAERGTRYPIVVYGPEGCGKTAWFIQAVEVLRELGFEVLYVNPLHKEFITYTDVRELTQKFVNVVTEAAEVSVGIRLAMLATLAIKELLSRWGRKRIALLVDEVFQAIGLDRAEIYVKELLGVIEYPPANYENIVIIVATSEGITRWRIGRHRWAWLIPMWNMSKDGFKELYDRLPSPKPDFESVWGLTGGNPNMLSHLYQVNWDSNILIKDVIGWRRLTPTFISRWRSWLEKAVEDPDNLWSPEVPEELINELEAKNLITYFLNDRDLRLWIDEPPPQKDLEIGVGKYVAWQTPIHREVVKKALEMYKP